MKLKTYSAGNMAAALALVKHDLGPDAVILHTRTYRRGGFLGIGCQTVVEITASNQAQMKRTKVGHKPVRKPGRALRIPPASEKSDAFPQQPTAGDLIRKTYAAAKAELTEKAGADRALAAPPTRGAAGDAPKPAVAAPAPVAAGVAPVAGPPDQLAVEMKAMKQMVAQMMRQSRRSAAPSHLPDKLVEQYQALLEQEVCQELADEVIHKVSRIIDDEQCGSDQAVQRAMRSVLAKVIPTEGTTGLFDDTPCDGRPRTLALVGPTGVGKTTTVAKLAATFKLKQKKSVGLITLDTYRIAAVDQLRTYAHIIGLPLRVVTNGREMADAMRSFARCDVVIIDTIGRSQRDGKSLGALADLVRAAQPHEVHLVLSSTCSQSVIMDTIEQFGVVEPDQIIFTKLDEAVSLGVLLNVARKVDKRLSYITTGQEVPHKIEPGEPQRIAELVLEGGLR